MSDQDNVEILKSTTRRWKRVAMVSWAMFVLVLLFAAVELVLMHRQAAERAADAERSALKAEEAAKQRLQAEEALGRSEKALAGARTRYEQLLYAHQIDLAHRALTQEAPRK